MKFCLISAATINDYKSREELDSDEHQRIPLGILALSSILETTGISPILFDLDRHYSDWLKNKDIIAENSDFALFIAKILAQQQTLNFGFSTICSSYPLTLRIVEHLRQFRPDAIIVLGGPEATATADETLAAFPSINIIARGEGEGILPILATELLNKRKLNKVPGISYRSGTNINRNPDAPVLKDINSLPIPAFHLYSNLSDIGYIPFEIGRGCPFSCKFCSTSKFFRRRFRLKSIDTAVQQMLYLKNTYGLSRFDFIHDNFTVDRNRVISFCKSIIDTKIDFNWACSSRADALDDELIKMMHKAGCRGLFLGIETGSQRMQEVIGKNLNLKKARQQITAANKKKIEIAAAFITSFPGEKMIDLKETVDYFINMYCFDYVDPQITLLSPLAGTEFYKKHKHELIFDEIISDMSFQGIKQDPIDREMIRKYPDIFSSFYSVSNPYLDRHYLNELRQFLLNTRFALRWLIVAIWRNEKNFLILFSKWLDWRKEHGKHRSWNHISTYYSSPMFRDDFYEFVRSVVAKKNPHISHILYALCDFYRNLLTDDSKENISQSKSYSSFNFNNLKDRPIIASNVSVIKTGVDYLELIRCLRRGYNLAQLPKKEVTVVTSPDSGRLKTMILSTHSAKLLSLCNGANSIQQISTLFKQWKPIIEGIPAEKACLYGLKLLHESGFIYFASA